MLGAAFSRREREIMDLFYRHGAMTARQVLAKLSGRVAYSTIRTQLRVLEQRKSLRHTKVGTAYVYNPTTTPGEARQTALRHLLETYFDGSEQKLVALLTARRRRCKGRTQGFSASYARGRA